MKARIFTSGTCGKGRIRHAWKKSLQYEDYDPDGNKTYPNRGKYLISACFMVESVKRIKLNDSARKCKNCIKRLEF